METSGRKMKLIAWIPCLLLGMLLFIVLYAVCQGLTAVAGQAGGWAEAAAGVAAGLAMLGLYAAWNRLWDRLSGRRWDDDLTLGRLLPDTGRGLLMGIVYFLLVVGIMALAGCYRVSGVQLDIAGQVRAIGMFFMVAVCEEVIFRGILFRMINRQFNAVAAFIVSALVFGAVHLANPGATWWAGLAIAIEAGVLLSAAYKYSGSLWMPIGIHWAWNYVQGNVLGFAVSGGDAGQSLITPEISGPDLLTGGPFGAEASLIAVVIGAALSALLIASWLRHSPRP